MLALPIGMSRSVEVHNINFNAFCDWIEGSVLFEQAEISWADIVDVLLEEEVYSSQDFAWQIVESSWREIERRQKLMGLAAAFAVGTRLEPLSPWQEQPALAFCLALSFARWYPKWARGFGADFNEQGDIFEALVKESLDCTLPGWEIFRTGWTRTEPVNLGATVRNVVSRLGELEGRLEPWTSARANEAGLDLLCYRPFADCRVGVPVLMMQCASGVHWEDKLHTPNLNIWRQLVNFCCAPKKAFSIPYALNDSDFMNNCNKADAIFLDRSRLLSPGRDDPNWLSTGLSDRILAWLEPRIAALPRIT